MFFEASRLGCRKTFFDATKGAYSMYSCTISGMSREMMKMDGRGSAEYQIWEWKDIMVILSLILSHKMTKFQIVTFFIKSQERKTWEAKLVMQ